MREAELGLRRVRADMLQVELQEARLLRQRRAHEVRGRVRGSWGGDAALTAGARRR